MKNDLAPSFSLPKCGLSINVVLPEDPQGTAGSSEDLLTETDSSTRLGLRSHCGDGSKRKSPVEGVYDVIAGETLRNGGSPTFVLFGSDFRIGKDARTNNLITTNLQM